MATAILVLAGLVAGSFVSAWLHRLRTGASVAVGRSACPSCGHQLAWYDLLPVASWLFLGGRCRYCRQPVSWQYPALEVVLAVLFALAPLGSGALVAAAYLVASLLLVAAATYDARWMELPDIISWLLVVAVALRIVGDGQATGAWVPVLLNAAVGAAVAGGFFGVQYVASRGRWIGSGDIILGAAAGLLVGWPGSLLALVVAYVVGGAVAVPLLALRRRGWSTAVAFGPFIAFGTLVAMRFGTQLTQLLGWTW